MAGPAAMYLAVRELAQRTTMVRALASVADQQVTWEDACVGQLLTRQAQNAVRARVPVALGEPIGEIRGVADTESARHEAGALEANVAAVRQPGKPRQPASSPGWPSSIRLGNSANSGTPPVMPGGRCPGLSTNTFRSNGSSK
jgi:hypothetical protein